MNNEQQALIIVCAFLFSLCFIILLYIFDSILTQKSNSLLAIREMEEKKESVVSRAESKTNVIQ